MTNEDIVKRLEKRTIKNSETGCWEWVGSNNGSGYGEIRMTDHEAGELYGYKRKFYVHRLSAYVFLNYALGSVLQVNHKCHNRCCWNPEHLYVGNQSENLSDAVAIGHSPGRTKFSCKRGHLFTEENTYWNNNTRYCRQCRKETNE